MGKIRNWIKDNVNIKIFLISTLVAFFALVPILSNRFVGIFGLTVLLGVVWMAIAYNFLDMINRLYGPQEARKAIVTAAVVRIMLWGVIAGLITLPVIRETAGFDETIRTGFRNLFAAEAALIISQYFIDIPMFAWISSRLKSYKFVIPAFVTNNITQSISTTIFLILLYTGVKSSMTMWTIIIGGLSIKLLMSCILTPIFAGIVKLIKPMVDENG